MEEQDKHGGGGRLVAKGATQMVAEHRCSCSTKGVSEWRRGVWHEAAREAEGSLRGVLLAMVLGLGCVLG